MKLYLYFLSISLFCSICFADVGLMCFYDSESENIRYGNSYFTVDNIKPHLCTHLIYTVVFRYHYLHYPENIFKSVRNIDAEFKKFSALKKENPKLKLLIELKVDEHGRDYIWSKTDDSRDALISRVLQVFDEFGFDGLHFPYIPWESSANYFFVNLIESLNEAFQPGGYLLGCSVDSYEETIYLLDNGYSVHQLSTYLDYLIVYAYDFHAPYFQSNKADHPSALYPQPWKSENDCANFEVTGWISEGFPAHKIVLSIALHGNSWTITSNTTIPPVQAIGPGSAGPITERSGMLAYHEICHAVKFDGWQVFHDPLQRMGPYAVSPVGNNRTWVGFDDSTMAIVKAKYVLSNKLGGIAIRDIKLDDFRNICGEGNYPVTSAVRHTLFSSKKNKNSLYKKMFRKKIDSLSLKLTA